VGDAIASAQLMSATRDGAEKHLNDVARSLSNEELARRLSPKTHPAPPRIAGSANVDDTVIEKRWKTLSHAASARPYLADAATIGAAESYARNIENFVGTVKVPVGVAGPLRVNGIAAQGDYYVPLATTEAALVASYHRGCTVLTLAGGCTAVTLNEGVGRSPAFAFQNLIEAGTFVQWCLAHYEELRTAAEATTRHGRMRDLKFTVEGNHVYLLLEFTTGDASGQNMVTIAAQAVCDFITANCPVKAAYFFVEGNMSGDKKACSQSFLGVRGRKVSAEARLPRELVTRHLHTTPEKMVDYWRMSAIGGVLSGTLGVQGHYANGLAALFIACGQDAACVSEASVGVTRFEVTEAGDLYASVTLPNLIVGTVGGGTGLPSQRACLEILGLAGTGHARAFAEVCAALALGGELSIIAALSAHHFAQAHARLARGQKLPRPTSAE
jgi:hydroxymethylglutaryl-CoA reductase (NADPH)